MTDLTNRLAIDAIAAAGAGLSVSPFISLVDAVCHNVDSFHSHRRVLTCGLTLENRLLFKMLLERRS